MDTSSAITLNVDLFFNPATLARFLGLLIVILALGTLVNRDRTAKLLEEMLASPAILLLTGLISLIIGLFIVCSQKAWVWDWTLFVYLSGWLVTIKGALITVFPGMFARIGRPYTRAGGLMALQALVSLCWGAALVIVSFMNATPKG